MLEVILGHRPDGAPNEPDIRTLEGWILGQEDSSPGRQLNLPVEREN